MNERLSLVAKHAFIYGVGIVLSKAASFLMLPIYTRYLSTSDYGTLELLQMTVDLIGMIVGAGLASSVFRFYAKYDDDKDRNEVVSSAAIAFSLIAAGTGAIGVALAPAITGVVFKQPTPNMYFRLFFVAYVVQSASVIPLLFMRALRKSVTFVVVNLARLVLTLALNIWFVVALRQGVSGVLYANIIANTAAGVYVAFWALRRTGVTVSWAKLLPMLKFGYPLVLSSLGSFVLTFSDRYFLNYFSSTAVVGIYSLAYQFGFTLAAFASTPFLTVWDPERFMIAKRDDAREVFGRVFFYFSVILIGLACVMSVLVRDVVRVMSAPAFWPAAALVPLLTLPFIFQSWTGYCNTGLYLTDRTGLVARSALISVVAVLALNFLLIPRFGAWGAAWATVGAFAVRFVLIYALSQREYRVTYPWGRVASLSALAMLTWGASLLVRPSGIVGSVSVSLAVLAVGACVGYWVVLRDDERGLLWRAIRQPKALLRV